MKKEDDLSLVPVDLIEPPEVPAYRTGFVEGYWEPKFLVGPNGFECYLGEPEDCNWERDGKRVVDELNRLYKLIEELRTKVRK